MTTAQFVFGVHSVEMLLKKHPERIVQLYLQDQRQDQRIQALLDLAQEQAIIIERVTKTSLDQKVPQAAHQGVVALIQAKAEGSETDLEKLLDGLTHPPLLLLLDGIQDPHNLGACLRTADAAGVDAVIIPKDRAVGLTPVVRKVASGAAETVPLIMVTNLSRTLQALKTRGIWIVGSAGEAEQSLYSTELTGPMAIVAGAEGEGMRRLTKAQCDYLAHIPMQGDVSSLNVSVAVGVLLFEAVRQRR